MGKYKIAIEETLQKIIEVEAETASLAVCTVEEQYNVTEIIPSAGDDLQTDAALVAITTKWDVNTG